MKQFIFILILSLLEVSSIKAQEAKDSLQIPNQEQRTNAFMSDQKVILVANYFSELSFSKIKITWHSITEIREALLKKKFISPDKTSIIKYTFIAYGHFWEKTPMNAYRATWPLVSILLGVYILWMYLYLLIFRTKIKEA